MVRHCAATGVPVFGVCLGMQSMAVAYGGVVDRAPELLHGKTSLVTHEGAGVFAGLPSPFTATRYHSLAVERGHRPRRAARSPPGRTEAAIIMGLRHRDAAGGGRAVPPRVGADRVGAPDAGQLAGRVRRRRGGRRARRGWPRWSARPARDRLPPRARGSSHEPTTGPGVCPQDPYAPREPHRQPDAVRGGGGSAGRPPERSAAGPGAPGRPRPPRTASRRRGRRRGKPAQEGVRQGSPWFRPHLEPEHLRGRTASRTGRRPPATARRVRSRPRGPRRRRRAPRLGRADRARPRPREHAATRPRPAPPGCGRPAPCAARRRDHGAAAGRDSPTATPFRRGTDAADAGGRRARAAPVVHAKPRRSPGDRRPSRAAQGRPGGRQARRPARAPRRAGRSSRGRRTAAAAPTVPGRRPGGRQGRQGQPRGDRQPGRSARCSSPSAC